MYPSDVERAMENMPDWEPNTPYHLLLYPAELERLRRDAPEWLSQFEVYVYDRNSGVHRWVPPSV